MIIQKAKKLGTTKMSPYQIKHYHTDNIFTVIEVSTSQIMGNFKSLQEAEAFMWSLIPRIK
jgi:uncharacterized protein YqgV (UPF0045/DUF77 family)